MAGCDLLRDVIVENNDLDMETTSLDGPFALARSSYDVRMSNNRIRTNSAVISAYEGAANWSITGNKMYSVDNQGPLAFVGLADAVNITISENLISVVPQSASSYVIHDNNGGAGSQGVVIKSNQIFHGSANGKILKLVSPGSIFDGNQILCAGRQLATVGGAEVVLSNNNFVDTAPVNLQPVIDIGAGGHSARIVNNSFLFIGAQQAVGGQHPGQRRLNRQPDHRQ